MSKIDVLVVGELREETRAGLAARFTTHQIGERAELEPLLATTGSEIRGVARGAHVNIDGAFIELLPKLEIIANFGVGYDGIDLKTAAARGIIVTNTPDVLTEEVADTAIGLLLMTVRELSAAERYLRAGKWPEANYRLTPATMRDRKVGIVGLGRIGLAIARRLDAMQVPVAYHTRRPRTDVPYDYFADVGAMAEAVNTLMVVVPGNAGTKNMIDAKVLSALGPNGILINIGRGIVVDEPALIEALQKRTILAAGLDVFVDEPNVPAALIALDNAVLLPHVGSGSVYTRNAMGQLVIDNLTSWFDKGKPITPVPETPWPTKK